MARLAGAGRSGRGGRGRSRPDKPTLVTVYWRDIPVQVIVRRGRESARAELPARFQEAIDKAAMRAGLAGTDEYLSEWHNKSESVPGDGELQSTTEARAVAEACARQLESEYDDARLQSLVTNHGRAAGDGTAGDGQ